MGVYSVVSLDAIHFHVCAGRQIVKKAVYIAIGLDMDGWRDVLGMYMQKCVIHRIRNTARFVSYKEIKPLLADLKRVYAAVDEQTASVYAWRTESSIYINRRYQT